MKFTLGFAFVVLVACVQGAPGPPPVPEENLTPQCRTPKCPSNDDANLPYPMDCLLYVKCTQGVSEVTACPADTQFNEVVGSCTDSATANCVNCWQKVPTP